VLPSLLPSCLLLLLLLLLLSSLLPPHVAIGAAADSVAVKCWWNVI